MAPPRKRRRLFSPEPLSLQTSSHSTTEKDIITTSCTATSQLPTSLRGARTVPTRIEEIHMQIQQQAARFADQPQQAQLHRRDVDNLVNGVASALLTGVTASSDPSSSNPTSITSGILASSTPGLGLNSSSSLFPSLSLSHLSGNGTFHHSTTLPLTYLATLTNDHVKTITRHSTAYETTFGDGQTLTVCNQFDNCRISTATSSRLTKSSTPNLQPQSTISEPSSPIPVGAGSPAASSPTAPPTSTSSTSHDQSASPPPPPPATIAGGIVGGFAGIAVILFCALAFLRWYKRRARSLHHALPASHSTDMLSGPGTYHPNSSGMVERAGLAPLVNALPPLFRHQNRRLNEKDSAPAEQGFTKVSGRKLPSAFSEGMTVDDVYRNPQSAVPLNHDANRSTLSVNVADTTLFRDNASTSTVDEYYTTERADERYYPTRQGDDVSEGSGGGYSVSPDSNPFADAMAPAAMTISPGPQRRPTIHKQASYRMSTSVHQAQPMPKYDRSSHQRWGGEGAHF